MTETSEDMKFNGMIEQQAEEYREALSQATPGTDVHRNALTITLLAYLCAKSDENGEKLDAIRANPLLEFGRKNKALLAGIGAIGGGTIITAIIHVLEKLGG